MSTIYNPILFCCCKLQSSCSRAGFQVLPYCTDDLVLCKRLYELGCQVLMPWAAPIGSGLGVLNPYALRTLRERLPDATLTCRRRD